MAPPVYWAYRGGAAAIRRLPVPVTRALSRAAATGAKVASPQRRRIVERNLRRVYGPDFGGAELERSVQQTFESYARYWAESFRLPSLDRGQLEAGFTFAGYEHIAACRDRGLGPILALPHLGGWEWAAFYVTEVLGIPCTAVVERLEPPELFEWFADYRRSIGLNVVPVGPHAASEVARAVKDRHVVCLLSDRDVTEHGVEVEFFGERTTLPAGPALLALRTGTSLIPAAVYFRGALRHAELCAPLDVERRGRLRDDVTRVTQDVAHALEDLIRAEPEQWHLMQPNWPSDHEALGSRG